MTAPIVHRYAGKFMALPHDRVNAYIVELDNSLVIVDSTIALSSARGLRAQAEALDKPIEAVLLTHGHPDHYTGLAVFEDLPRLSSQGALDFAHREDIVKAPVATMLLGDDYPKVRVFPNEIVKDGETVEFGGVGFTFTDLGPGESDSDGMWVFEHDGAAHAFVGDAIAKDCHCFFRDGHTPEWLKILDRLESQFDETTQFHIGHGEAPIGTGVIRWQRGYIETFLSAVDHLRDRADPTGRPAQEEVIVQMKDYLPTDSTLFLLDYELDYSIGKLLEATAPL